ASGVHARGSLAAPASPGAADACACQRTSHPRPPAPSQDAVLARLGTATRTELVVVGVQAVVERLQADAEDLGGTALVAAPVVERRQDETPLHVAGRRTEREPPVEPPARRLPPPPTPEPAVDVAAGEDAGPLDHVPELTGVARPRVRFELAERALGEPLAGLSRLVHPLQEVAREKCHVAFPLAERRHGDGEDAQAVVQILA